MLRESKRGTAAQAQQPALWTEEAEAVGLITVSQFNFGFKLRS